MSREPLHMYADSCNVQFYSIILPIMLVSSLLSSVMSFSDVTVKTSAVRDEQARIDKPV